MQAVQHVVRHVPRNDRRSNKRVPVLSKKGGGRLSAQGLYEQHLEDALRDLLHWHRNGNRLTKQDALQKLNKTVSDKIEEIQREEKDD